jgi:hypothetical protein
LPSVSIRAASHTNRYYGLNIHYLLNRNPWRTGKTRGLLHSRIKGRLYTSELGFSTRFAVPAIAGGRVYSGARRALYIYGLLQ